jgi:hypothetical protein
MLKFPTYYVNLTNVRVRIIQIINLLLVAGITQLEEGWATVWTAEGSEFDCW